MCLNFKKKRKEEKPYLEASHRANFLGHKRRISNQHLLDELQHPLTVVGVIRQVLQRQLKTALFDLVVIMSETAHISTVQREGFAYDLTRILRPLGQRAKCAHRLGVDALVVTVQTHHFANGFNAAAVDQRVVIVLALVAQDTNAAD